MRGWCGYIDYGLIMGNDFGGLNKFFKVGLR